MNNNIKWKINSFPVYLIIIPILWLIYEILEIINFLLFYNICIIVACFIFFSACFFNTVLIFEYGIEVYKLLCLKKESIKNEDIDMIIYNTSGRRLGKINIYTKKGNIKVYTDFVKKRSLSEIFDFFETKGIKIIKK